jgi:hypothetical protein
MLSSTDDFPELWRHQKKTQRNVSRLARSGRGGKRISERGRRVKVRTYLSADDCDGGESLPEGTPAATAVVAEDRARALDPVHQPDQAPHGRHLGRAPPSTCLFAGGSNKTEEVVDGERWDLNEWEEMKFAGTVF